MFNSTHTLVGLAIARTRTDEWDRHSAVTAVIASNLPDIEIVTALAGTPAYIEHHRGITHSLVGIPILAVLLAALAYTFSRNFWKTFALILVTMATHPLLDYANNYGWRPFLPFDGTWYYGDILYIFDPFIDMILVLGLLGGGILANRRKFLAWMSLVLVIAYIGVRIELHEMAKSKMAEFVAHDPTADKWAVLPQMLSPFTWDGIVQTKTQLVRLNLNVREGAGRETARVERGVSTEIVRQAANAKSADVLLRFARFPAVRVEANRFGYGVTFFDFRFYNETGKTALGAEVTLDKSMRVVRESLSFVQTLR
jgi:inner membrane protein